MKSFRQISMATAAWIAVLQGGLPMAGAASPFEDTVRPILEKNCFSCHGPEKQKSGYRLDVKSIALTGGEGHAPNIIPGNAAASPLMKFISGADQDLIMPPKGPPLSPAEIETVRAWIEAGAPWPDSASVPVSDPLDWWSLKPITKSAPPTAAAHPIDAFIHAKLAENGLAPSPEADARTLGRRLYFDLTGLPPSPEEIGAFAADSSPEAYARLVDRLLASPRYGERG
jgi:mono/diheme cytochrome c family protein